MKKLIFTLAHLLIFTSLIAQQNEIWSLPPNYLQFDGGNPPTAPIPLPKPTTDPFGNPLPLNTNPYDGYDGQESEYSHNAMQDVNGELLFFVVDGFVYDKNGHIIGAMAVDNSVDLAKGFVETIIIPEPGSCTRFYILGTKHIYNSGHLSNNVYYALLDMSLTNHETGSIGAFIHYDPNYGTPDNQAQAFIDNILSISDMAPNFYNIGESDVKVSMAVSKIRTQDNSRLFFALGEEGLYRYKITSSGITYDNEFVLSYPHTPVMMEQSTRSEMELIETTSGYRIAFSYPSDIGITLFVGELDYNGNVVSFNTKIFLTDSPVSGFKANIKGLEFSPNGQYLYVTHDPTNTNPFPFKIYEVSTNNFISLTNLTMQSQIPAFKNSQIELGKDGKLYLANATSLATIGNSNNPGIGGSGLIWNNSALNITYNLNDLGASGTNNAEFQKLFPLPDQVDGMDYTSYFTEGSLACCIKFTSFSTTTYNHEQGGVQNWTTSLNPFGNASIITVKDELVIKFGADITATGLTFEFASDAKLTIEKGAKFTANNCVFTVNTECENAPMWIGVDVQGPSANQQSVDAGRFIANNSLIEHAYWATHNYSTAKGAPGVFWETGNRGGVILATNTTFRNNHRATVFFDFQNTNGIDDESKFYNCTFVTDAPLNKPNLTPTVIMAHLFGVQGVNFLGCDFKFTSTDPSIAAHERGSGIEAYNCLLTVNSTLTGGGFPDRSNFVNLTRGVDAYSSIGSPRTTRVTNSDFDNVWRCIYLKSNELATITNNTFDVASDNAWSHGYGLYLDYCNRFKVENNAFTTTHNGFIGTYTWDSQQGTNNNEIYRNTFSNFVIGSQAAGNNGNRSAINGGLGLEYRCNNYTNINNADIYVSSGWIKPFHGQCGAAVTAPSNNKFSYTAQYGDFLQDTIVDHVSYQHSIGTNLAPRNGYYYAPNTNPTVCNDTYNAATSCPTRIRRSRIELMQELSAEKLVVSNLNEGIAVGDAKALYEAIQTQSAGNVKNVLMAASPYLSDNVLIAYMQSNAPIGNLKQVLLANSPLSDDVMAALNQLNIPRGIKTQIINAQTGISAMQELKTEIAYHKNEVSKIQNDVLRYILFEDDVVERYKEAIEFIKQESACFEKRCELIAFYTVNKEYTKAEQELSDIAQYQENADFVKLYSNIVQLEQATDAIEELKTNTSILQPVIEVAEMPIRKQETAMAEVMLKQAKLRNYQEPIEELNVGGSGLRLMNQEEKKSTISSIQATITVFPNPTSEEVTILHNLNQENGKVMFKVYNMLGVEVINEYLNSTNNEVKVNTLKPGVYFYTITQNNQTIKTDKLMVK